ncbi:MAG TPA: DUF835 domain-containing protein [Thermoplasmata archaeon]|jgi:hypothetical protein|nr:DUF835 domain-containing protein [Thermoplasmata archaeon]
MIAYIWLASLGAGAICLGAGMMGWMSSPKSKPAFLFLLAMSGIFVSMVTAPMIALVSPDQIDVLDTLARAFFFSIIMSTTFLWQLALIFPVERSISFYPPNARGLTVLAGLVVPFVLTATVDLDYTRSTGVTLSEQSLQIIVMYIAFSILAAMVLVVMSRAHSNEAQKRSGTTYLAGLWVFALSGIPYAMEASGRDPWVYGDVSVSSMSVIAGLTASGLIFATSIAMGRMTMMSPTTEKSASSSKASYNLRHRFVYLVEEEKPDFAFHLFTDILRGRCYDCANDDSFPCESLDCSTCKLPCPCRECKRYRSRAEGLIVTRQYPNDIRTRYYLQTTPMIWLSTVAGKDNMDPAKLSVITDILVNFMERSNNGILLVDGVEYLMTSNDFPKVLRAVDRWTESAMTSSSRIIMSIDPRAFDEKELALLEKNKEVVRPNAEESWQIIPERI